MELQKITKLGGCGCAIGQNVQRTVEGVLGRANRYQNLKKKTLAGAAAQSGRMCSALLKAFWRGKRNKNTITKTLAGAAARSGRMSCALLKAFWASRKAPRAKHLYYVCVYWGGGGGGAEVAV